MLKKRVAAVDIFFSEGVVKPKCKSMVVTYQD
jgi:hypothetical protein